MRSRSPGGEWIQTSAASASGGVLHTSISVKNSDGLVYFSALLLRTRLFCRSQVPYQAPPLSDEGLFISTLGVKRQAPPLPCFVLDKKLTIPCWYCELPARRHVCGPQGRSLRPAGWLWGQGRPSNVACRANRAGITPAGCIAPAASRAYSMERLSQSLTLRRYAA